MLALSNLLASCQKLKTSRSSGVCLAAAWIVCVVIGLKMLLDFDMTPGAVGSPPASRPAEVAATTDKTRPVLIMFAHPNCPCSRTSLAELSTIVDAHHDRVDVHIYFHTSGTESKTVQSTSLWKQAAAIPGANLIHDRQGDMASRCQVQTSGHVLLYSAAGKLLFSGGITAARGHGGDNPGRTAVLEHLAGRRAARSQHTVYGCPLFDPISPTANETSCSDQN